MLYLDGKRHFNQTVEHWKQHVCCLPKPFSIWSIRSLCVCVCVCVCGQIRRMNVVVQYTYFCMRPCKLYSRTVTWLMLLYLFGWLNFCCTEENYSPIERQLFIWISILFTLCFTVFTTWLFWHSVIVYSSWAVTFYCWKWSKRLVSWLCQKILFLICFTLQYITFLYSVVAYTHKSLWLLKWEALYWMCQTASREEEGCQFFLTLNHVFTLMQ